MEFDSNDDLSTTVANFQVFIKPAKTKTVDQPWVGGSKGMQSNKDQVIVRNTDNDSYISFNFFGSHADVQSGTKMDEDGLKSAFAVFLSEALMVMVMLMQMM